MSTSELLYAIIFFARNIFLYSLLGTELNHQFETCLQTRRKKRKKCNSRAMVILLAFLCLTTHKTEDKVILFCRVDTAKIILYFCGQKGSLIKIVALMRSREKKLKLYIVQVLISFLFPFSFYIYEIKKMFTIYICTGILFVCFMKCWLWLILRSALFPSVDAKGTIAGRPSTVPNSVT